jgi:hypothetical protein
MRRPLSSELSPEDRKLVIRWSVAISCLYSAIALLIVGGGLVFGSSSTADKVSIAAKSFVDCAPPRPCGDREPDHVGRRERAGSM